MRPGDPIAACATCPYCRGVPGVGPRPVKPAAKPFDQVLGVGPQVVLTPTVGTFMPGYLLLVTTDHMANFGEMGESRLRVLEPFISTLTGQLAGLFGDYLVFEHGASPEQAVSRGSCVSHAHLHLMPAAKASDSLLAALPWEPLTTLPELARFRESGYAMCGIAGRYYVANAPLPSQWIRRKVVEWLALETHWDWGAYFGEDELHTTLEKLRGPVA